MSNDPSALQPFDHRAQLDRVFQDARDAIDEALGFIQRQEDGPFTMTVAIKEIGERLDEIEIEINRLDATADYFQRVAQKLLVQRDDAIRQRDQVVTLEAERRRSRKR